MSYYTNYLNCGVIEEPYEKKKIHYFHVDTFDQLYTDRIKKMRLYIGDGMKKKRKVRRILNMTERQFEHFLTSISKSCLVYEEKGGWIGILK